jgi:HSP20 family molecular chaperone IbpA
MSWLKRVFGTTDAMEDARERAGAEGGAEPTTTTTATSTTKGTPPPGWGKPEVSEEGGDLVIALEAPGLHEDSIRLEPRGSSIGLKAQGEGDSGRQILLDETLKLPEGSDPSAASVSYSESRLIVRLPKSALKPGG